MKTDMMKGGKNEAGSISFVVVAIIPACVYTVVIFTGMQVCMCLYVVPHVAVQCVCVCMHACTHTHTHLYSVHTCQHHCIHTHIHTHTYRCIYVYMHTDKDTDAVCIRTSIRTYMDKKLGRHMDGTITQCVCTYAHITSLV